MSILNIEFENVRGELKTLKDFDAKAYLIVNTASKCGLTKQYEDLQKLYKEFSGYGLQILAFPSNDFLAQEPGSDSEIQSFCELNYGVEFPVLKKITVKGDHQHPLYKSLTDQRRQAVRNTAIGLEKALRDKNLITGKDHDIHWNFEKFIVNSQGEVIERFFPDILPFDERIISTIKSILS